MNKRQEIDALTIQIAALQDQISACETLPQKDDSILKAELGQFMTPPQIAHFMAGLLLFIPSSSVHILDAGAGMGALTCAALDRATLTANSIEVTAFEIDPGMLKPLESVLSQFNLKNASVHSGDYIRLSSQKSPEQCFTHAILNPPYKKISSQSDHRKMLRSVGIETTNLYSAFVSLALRELRNQGELVAIIPRSFCNGPYFKPFRELLLELAAIRQLHLFKSRSEAFKDDSVLQENIIIHVQRGAVQGDVIVSTSNDGTFSDIVETTHPFSNIVNPADLDKFINIPTEGENSSSTSLPVQTSDGLSLTLTPGEHSELIRDIIEDFAPRFAPGSLLIYAGDTGAKLGFFDTEKLKTLGVEVDSHGKMPDVVLHYLEKDWLILIDSVTSHGPSSIRPLFAY